MIINANLETTKLEFATAAQGIRNPAVVILPAGSAIFRFASTKNPQTGAEIDPSLWARSSWWFQENDYRTILQRYGSGGQLKLGTIGRIAGAVPPSWSLMDVSIKARLVVDIKVYVGKGATQYRDMLPNGMYVTLRGWTDISQVYIPGMRGPALTAIPVIRQKIITSDSFGFLSK